MEPALKRTRTVAPIHRNESVGAEFVRRIPTLDNQHRVRGFNDYIHGTIEMGPLEQRIIDTEEFQRLDELHQLGTAKFVYRGAKHSRFEHSLGVAHLAEKLVLSLRRRQGLANITEEDVLCVKIAGLCHDLGHGPFSHLFDDVIVPEFFPGKIIPGMNGGEDWKWSHESASLKLFDALLENNGIQLSDYGLDDQDRQFIKELISPPKEPHLRTGRKLPNGKVDFDKAFLYDIVNNTQSGLDVDKLDYFSRDSQRVGVIVSDRHEYQRLFQNARVCYVKKGGREYTQICFRDKLVKDLLDVFRTRFDLHYKVYQHKTVKAIEFMIRDALVIAATDRKRTISVSGKPSPVCPDGRYGIAEAVHEMTAYAKLKDSILDFIAASSEPELEEARILIKRIRTRDLYRCCGELETFPEALFEEEDNEDRLLDEIIHSYHRAYPEAAARTSGAKRKRPGGEQGAKREDDDASLRKHELILHKKTLHWGKGAQNPISKIHIYTKDMVREAEKVEEKRYETLLPKAFQKRSLLLFCKSKKMEAAARLAFRAWSVQFLGAEGSGSDPTNSSGESEQGFRE